MTDRLKDARHWRNRAKEARIFAYSLKHHIARQRMLGVAAIYDHLARSAETTHLDGPGEGTKDSAVRGLEVREPRKNADSTTK